MAVVVCLALLVAGCTAKTPSTTGDPSDGNGTTPTPTDGTTDPGPGPGPGPDGNVTIPQIRWENCTGMFGLFERPRDQARAVVPAEFDLVGFTPQTASIRFVALQCARVVTPNAVLENHGQFTVYAEVEPAEESWGPDTMSFYSLDFLTTAAELDEAVADLGGHSKASTLTRTTDTAPDGTATERWKFEASDLVVELEYVISTDDTPGIPGDINYWHSSGTGFRKVESYSTYTLDQIVTEGGLLRMTGSSNTAPLLANSCCTDWNGQIFHTYTDVWTANETIYR